MYRQKLGNEKQVRLSLTLRREDELLLFSIFSYYRRGKLISLDLLSENSNRSRVSR